MSEFMSPERHDEQARRTYWTGIMDEAAGFVQSMIDYPVQECGEPMVSLIDAVKHGGVEVTFCDKPHVEGLDRMYFLRAGLIDDFIGISRAMNDRGWRMHVEDAFRTRAMQRGLGRQDYTFGVIVERVLWELDGQPLDSELVLRRAGALIALIPKVGTHMSGSAVDVSVFSCDDGDEVDRGGPYFEMSERTPMDSPFLSAEARRNREEITAIFERFGFATYPYEFWHYSKGDAYDAYLHDDSKLARYGAIDCDPVTGEITPIEHPCVPLNSIDDIRRMIERSA